MTETPQNPTRSSMRLKNKEYPPFLRLPREIRDLIYVYLLTSELEPPEASIELDKESIIEENQGDGSNYYERAPPTFACQGLLATCRQIHRETVEAISSCNGALSTALKYKLDLMVWSTNLRPTWLWLPAPPKYVKYVVVDMKSLDHLRSQPITGARLRHPHILAQYLLQMLRRFFENGPRIIRQRPKAQRDCNRKLRLFVEKFTINLVSLPSYLYKGCGEFQARTIELWRLEQGTMKFFIAYLREIVTRGALFGKVGTLELSSGGHTLWEWEDMASGPLSPSIERLQPYGWGPVLQRTQELVDNRKLKWNKLLDCKRPLHSKRTAEKLARPRKKRRRT